MAKNIIKTNSNTEKNKKLSPTFKLSYLLTNNKNGEDSPRKLHQQDPNNILLNFYSKNDINDNIISDFMEKINKLNKKFYISSEKFVLTKTSFDKISDELFMNLFKQIDCYVEEIQRLNKKIISIDERNNKIIIKQLTKELSENKEKIRNYEAKLKEKTLNEEKLSKELEYYKRRIIFFKNKININLMARNTERANIKKNKKDYNINSSIASKKSASIRIQREDTKGGRRRKSSFFSSSPEKPSKHRPSGCFSTKNIMNYLPQEKDYMSSKNIQQYTIGDNNINSTSYDNIINGFKNNDADINKNLMKNMNTDNENNKLRRVLSDGETKKNNIIKINRKYKEKDSILFPFIRNYTNDDTLDNKPSRNNTNNIYNIKNIYINEKSEENRSSPGKNSKKNLNNNKNDNEFNNIGNANSKLDNKDKTENGDNNNILELKNLYSFPNIRNKRKTGNKNPTYNNKKNYVKISKYKEGTNKKKKPSHKLFNLPSKKSMKSNSKITNNDSINNTIQTHNNCMKSNDVDNCKKNKNNFFKNNNKKKSLNNMKSKTDKCKLKKNNKLEKKILNFEDSEDDDLPINSIIENNNFSNTNTYNKNTYRTSNDININRNFSDIINKGADNIANFSSGSNSLILKKDKKIASPKKNKVKTKKIKEKNDNHNQNDNKKTSNKDIINTDSKNKDKELTKILKEMNEDYYNDIEMLKTQEEQIKLMLSLINLNED